MPIHQKKTSKSTGYFQYGTTGKKYYYKTVLGQKRAKAKAILQMKAIKS